MRTTIAAVTALAGSLLLPCLMLGSAQAVTSAPDLKNAVTKTNPVTLVGHGGGGGFGGHMGGFSVRGMDGGHIGGMGGHMGGFAVRTFHGGPKFAGREFNNGHFNNRHFVNDRHFNNRRFNNRRFVNNRFFVAAGPWWGGYNNSCWWWTGRRWVWACY